MSLKKFSVIALFILIVLVIINNTFKISSIILLHYKIYLLNAIGDKQSIGSLSKEIIGLTINSNLLFNASLIFIFPFVRIVLGLFKSSDDATKVYVHLVSGIFVFLLSYSVFIKFDLFDKYDIFILLSILILLQSLIYDILSMVFGKLLDLSLTLSNKLQNILFKKSK